MSKRKKLVITAVSFGCACFLVLSVFMFIVLQRALKVESVNGIQVMSLDAERHFFAPQRPPRPPMLGDDSEHKPERPPVDLAYENGEAYIERYTNDIVAYSNKNPSLRNSLGETEIVDDDTDLEININQRNRITVKGKINNVGRFAQMIQGMIDVFDEDGNVIDLIWRPSQFVFQSVPTNAIRTFEFVADGTGVQAASVSITSLNVVR